MGRAFSFGRMWCGRSTSGAKAHIQIGSRRHELKPCPDTNHNIRIGVQRHELKPCPDTNHNIRIGSSGTAEAVSDTNHNGPLNRSAGSAAPPKKLNKILSSKGRIGTKDAKSTRANQGVGDD
jgi:hypothetical protein